MVAVIVEQSAAGGRRLRRVRGAIALTLQSLVAATPALSVEAPQPPAMVAVPAGSFAMGSERGDADERPIHPVRVSRPFAIQRFETTVEEYATFVASTARPVAAGCAHYVDGHTAPDPVRSWRQPGFDQTVRHPVVCVSYDDAAAYAQWLSAATGRRFRLPSEAEWEYVAKYGMRDELPWSLPREACESANLTDLSRALVHYRGQENFANPALYPTLSDQLVPCDDRFAFTAPVGAFRPNALGVHDLFGNAWEWVSDCAGAASGAVPRYPAPVAADGGAASKEGAAQPPTAEAVIETPCVRRGIRGGAWHTGEKYARASNRSSIAADARMYHLGFRLVEDLGPAPRATRSR
jgi:formylglycine-generating enzyme required for sulfatase activity